MPRIDVLVVGADLRGAYLRGADLRGADLSGAVLRALFPDNCELTSHPGQDSRGIGVLYV